MPSELEKINHQAQTAGFQLTVTYKMNTRLFYFLLIALSIVSCNETPRQVRKQASARTTETPLKPNRTVVSYTLDSLSTPEDVKAFDSIYTPEEQHVILQLNRLDKQFLKKGMALVIPDKILNSFSDYTTFPYELPQADTLPKLILISLRIQSFAVYESGKLIRVGPISSGKKAAPTPPGLYHTNWKKKIKTSTIDDNWIMPWYFNIENKEGIALHQYEMPGYPGSHACIRLAELDAKWFYDWADSWELDEKAQKVLKNGTPVIVFGNYDFNSSPDWFLLPGNPKALDLTEAEMQEIVRGLMTVPQV